MEITLEIWIWILGLEKVNHFLNQPVKFNPRCVIYASSVS